ncbi:hypothetical protein [Acutalibacter caecimuris]|uniref:hypothetical protein n=1 Tax=Acutalibacter caecimuris TaxID=3093657 RepID=UPI002AC9D053|nr:hypothetical protein [Acutalibacter sp. M00118]
MKMREGFWLGLQPYFREISLAINARPFIKLKERRKAGNREGRGKSEKRIKGKRAKEEENKKKRKKEKRVKKQKMKNEIKTK